MQGFGERLAAEAQPRGAGGEGGAGLREGAEALVEQGLEHEGPRGGDPRARGDVVADRDVVA